MKQYAPLDLINLSSPDVVRHIHMEYLKAGSTIISTNTFNVSSLLMREEDRDSGLKALTAGIDIARQSISGFNRGSANSVCCGYMPDITKDNPRYVNIMENARVSRSCRRDGSERPLLAVSMGPSEIPLSVYRKMGDHFSRLSAMMIEAYYFQTLISLNKGADLLLLETVYDMASATMALSGIVKAFGDSNRRLPIFVSAVVGGSGRLSDETPLEDLLGVAQDSGADYFGLNCVGCDAATKNILREISRLYPGRSFFSPNAGYPDSSGLYSLTPGEFADAVYPLLRDGEIAGGCLTIKVRQSSFLCKNSKIQAIFALQPKSDEKSLKLKYK